MLCYANEKAHVKVTFLDLKESGNTGDTINTEKLLKKLVFSEKSNLQQN